ncbi:DNA damage-inducible protein DinB [Gaertneriomyces semiglobifer]|nr:DNA damage-inducible protein DinB [Gaertneriomyces semiglobifer]
MSARTVLETHHRYNIWAYEQIFAAVDKLTDEQYHSNVGMPFRSIHGMLNHLLLAERLWYKRIVLRADQSDMKDLSWYWTHEPSYSTPESTEIHWEKYITDRQELKAALQEQNRLWLNYVSSLDPTTDISQTKQYADSHGCPKGKPLHKILLHIVNHGTHHRGQITIGLFKLGIDLPVVDMPYFVEEHEF